MPSKITGYPVDVVTLYDNGMNVKEISKQFNYGRDALRSYIKLNSKNYRGRHKHILNTDYFKSNDKDMYWLIGLLAADGCVYKNTIKLSQSGPTGYSIISHITKLLDYKNPIGKHNPKNGNTSYNITISSKEMIDDIGKFGIIPQKTKSYKLPEILEENNFKNFIRGYIDGDGCVGIYDNGSGSEYLQVSVVGTKNFIHALQSRILLKNNKILEKGGVFELRYTGETAIVFLNWLYSDIETFKSHKYELFKSYIDNFTPKKWSIYNKKKFIFYTEYFNNSVDDAASALGVPFQTIYSWKKSKTKIIKKSENLYIKDFGIVYVFL
jgi:hypothetical protein